MNWPRVLTVWRANLIGSSGKGAEYFLRHLLGTDANIQAGSAVDGVAAVEVTCAADVRHMEARVVSPRHVDTPQLGTWD